MLQEITNLCTCCRILLYDGTILAYTDYDQDLNLDGIIYRADQHFNYSNISRNNFLQVDGMEIESALYHKQITAQDIMAGRYDHAQVEVLHVDYISQQKSTLLSGTIGKIKVMNDRFVAEINGSTQKTQRAITNSFSPSCRATFCDHLCKLSSKDFTRVGAVVDVIISRKKFIGKGLPPGQNYYQYGLVTFLSGENKNQSVEIKSSLANEIELYIEPPYEIRKNDQYSIIAGCDKLFTTCPNKFNNTINFRGEPTVPGLQKLYRSREGEI